MTFTEHASNINKSLSYVENRLDDLSQAFFRTGNECMWKTLSNLSGEIHAQRAILSQAAADKLTEDLKAAHAGTAAIIGTALAVAKQGRKNQT